MLERLGVIKSMILEAISGNCPGPGGGRGVTHRHSSRPRFKSLCAFRAEISLTPNFILAPLCTTLSQ